MTERDLGKIEAALDVTLPDHYRRFLLEQSSAVAKAKRKGAFVPFFTAAKEIIAANKELRADPSLRSTNGDTESWPLRYLIVGTDGSDDWCVDLRTKREVVWLFDSEANGTFRPADPPTWLGQMQAFASPPQETLPLRDYVCKKGKPADSAAGDGSFALTDIKGREWLCYERQDANQEDILARLRGEVATPDWLSDKGVRSLAAVSPDELRDVLGKER